MTNYQLTSPSAAKPRSAVKFIVIFAVLVCALASFVIYKFYEYQQTQQAMNNAAVAVERLHKEIEKLNKALDAREKALDTAQKAFRPDVKASGPSSETIDPSFLITIPDS